MSHFLRLPLLAALLTLTFTVLVGLTAAGRGARGSILGLILRTDSDHADITLIDTGRGSQHVLLPGRLPDLRTMAWSPDGARLAVTSNADGDRDIYLIEIATGSVRRLTDNNTLDSSPVWSPDGTRLAYIVYDQGFDVAVIRLDDGSIDRLTPGGRRRGDGCLVARWDAAGVCLQRQR